MLQGLLAVQTSIDQQAQQAADLLAQLSESRLYENVGYASGLELARALLRECPLLDVLLDVATPQAVGEASDEAGTPPSTPLAEETGAGPKVRVHGCRKVGQTAGDFARLSSARARLREMELATSSACSRARLLLTRIERQKLYLECAYTSFEDFLSRALGPNPVFANLLLAPTSAPIVLSQSSGSFSPPAPTQPPPGTVELASVPPSDGA